mgnify:CR=1 FL=1
MGRRRRGLPQSVLLVERCYGVLRNTFAEGTYDFADSDSNAAKLTHNENEFDAYYFLSDGTSRAAVAQDVLDGYFAVTGDPVLLPEYGFYLAT